MNISIMEEKDIFIMKLLNYFITKKSYAPIIIHGVDNEIWLENPKEEYRIIRIVTRNIFNEEQFKFDSIRAKHILKQLKKKMFLFSIPSLTILVDVGDNFNLENQIDKNYEIIVASNEEDIYKNDILNKYYKDIKNSLVYDEEGFELIGKITSEISKKNIEESERRKNMLKKNTPYISYFLIVINVVIFLLMYSLGEGSENLNTLINFGANYAPLVKSGDYYRLITSAFLHIGLVHLICNMYALYIIGTQVEQYFGKLKFLLIYFFSAITGSLFTLVLSNQNTVSAGASGAIFGLFSAILYFGYHYRGYIGNTIIRQITPVIILNLFISFSVPNVGAAAHIGGLIGGYTISSALGADLSEDNFQKISGYIITILLTIFLIYMGFFR